MIRRGRWKEGRRKERGIGESTNCEGKEFDWGGGGGGCSCLYLLLPLIPGLTRILQSVQTLDVTLIISYKYIHPSIITQQLYPLTPPLLSKHVYIIYTYIYKSQVQGQLIIKVGTQDVFFLYFPTFSVFHWSI